MIKASPPGHQKMVIRRASPCLYSALRVRMKRGSTSYVSPVAVFMVFTHNIQICGSNISDMFLNIS